MAILTGRRLGPYEILSAIGAGGMGEVYRARDTRLDRTVAIKVLPQHLAYGLACDPKLLRHRTLALAFHQNGPPNTSIDLHGVHPSGVPRTWFSTQPFVKPRSGGLLFLRRITRSHGVTRSIFAPAFTNG